jgi:hypothetical protein
MCPICVYLFFSLFNIFSFKCWFLNKFDILFYIIGARNTKFILA